MYSLPGSLENCRDERGGRCLAIGAGDAADARPATFEHQVHLAPYGNAMRTSDFEFRRVPGNSRARTDHERIRRHVVGVTAEPDFDGVRQEFGPFPSSERRGSIDEHHAVPFASERPRAGKTAPSRADDHDRLFGHAAAPATCAKRTVIAVPTAAAAANETTSL